MATKRKPTPAQIAARERFAEMARSGAFKKKAAKARKKNPSRSGIGFEGYDPYASMDRLDEYRQKSDAELRYIIQDAGEAARAQRGMSSEAKYLDQVNDATTVLYERRLAREKAIAASNRSGRKIGKREASAINRLLTGRSSNPRASNPIILVSDKPIASKRKVNPVKRVALPYVVEAKRDIGGETVNMGAIAAFPGRAQADDYAKALQSRHKGLKLTVKAK